MSTYEDDEPDFGGEDEGELDLSGFDSDDDEPLSFDDELTEDE